MVWKIGVHTTSESILSPLCLRFIVSSVDVKEKNWSSDLQWNAVTNRHSRSVTHPCETKVIKQHLLQINLKASRSVTQSNTSLQNRRWKLGQYTKLFCFDIDFSLNHIFFRNKTFLFFKIESWNFFSIGCLIELKFCEVLQNLFSNRCFLSCKTKKFYS